MQRFYKPINVVENVEMETSNWVESTPNMNAEFDVSQLVYDPGLRPPILSYNVNIRNQLMRAYLLKGPCQPIDHNFPKRKFGEKQERRFHPGWYDGFKDWLEYSVEKDVVYCLYCYLFKTNRGNQSGGNCFVSEGFSYWKSKERLSVHVGKHDSEHNKARIKCDALLNSSQHIQTILHRQSRQSKDEYRLRLSASIDCIRVLLRQGLPFRGHDESEDSLNPGNFLIQLQFLVAHNDEIKAVTLNNAPKNCKLTSPPIQKEIVSACAAETIGLIMADIGDSLFSILVDESRDVSTKEQMSIVLRYVDKLGHVNERLIGIEHVTSTTALSLKAAIEKVFATHNLSISRLRGQGYDGASNMQGKFNGLKSLILQENPCAFYIHCFAHQLQLALIAVAKKNMLIGDFFRVVNDLINMFGGSCKRSDLLREKHSEFIAEELEKGELSSGTGLNQETSLRRAGDTQWGSHYHSLISLHTMFSSVGVVLEMIYEDSLSSPDQKLDAFNLLEKTHFFDFSFNLHLMRNILGISYDLSQALQMKDQDIVNAMDLVKGCKEQLQLMRDSGWDSFLKDFNQFCETHNIDVVEMGDMYTRIAPRGRPHRNPPQVTNLHHYRANLFYAVIDLQLQELNDRFSEVNTELLLCVASLCPRNLFSAFDKEKLIKLAALYKQDFSRFDLSLLHDQLESYVFDMRSNKAFEGLKGLGDLAEKLVMTRKDKVYPLVYKLLTLALILPVATATVERVFSAMSFVKDKLRNRMSDEWMNDSLIAYVERDVFLKIDNETIIKRFQNMKTRKEQL